MPKAVASGVLRRALGNAGLLLSGKGAAGVMQLATLALAGRTLGLEQFGLFSVMLAQMQLLVALATFQSNQAIVRYGVGHLNANDTAGFQGLVKFGTALDLAAALAAGVAAFLLAPILAEQAGWDADYVAAAQLLALLPLANAIATPKGMLRLFGRFDLLARQVTVTPLARLLGAVLLSLTSGSLLAFAAVWVVAGTVGALVAVVFAWREARRRDLLAGITPSLRGARRRNPGIGRFAMLANVHSSFALLPNHLSTLIVGLTLGPAAAGLTRVAQEIGTALAKPIELINQTVYPDIARLSAANAWRRVRKLIVRSGVTAAGIGAMSTLLLYFLGEAVIRLIFGPEYDDAYRLLLLISVATTLTVSVFAAEPTLYALGQPSRPMITSMLVVATFLAVLFAALPGFGLLAPGFAFIAGGLTAVVCSLFWLATSLPREDAQ